MILNITVKIIKRPCRQRALTKANKHSLSSRLVLFKSSVGSPLKGNLNFSKIPDQWLSMVSRCHIIQGLGVFSFHLGKPHLIISKNREGASARFRMGVVNNRFMRWKEFSMHPLSGWLEMRWDADLCRSPTTINISVQVLGTLLRAVFCTPPDYIWK